MRLIEQPETRIADMASLAGARLESGRYVCPSGGVDFHFMLRRNVNIDLLFVLLSAGARNAETDAGIRQPLDRWSWFDVFPGSMLNIADPALASGKINEGWYLGPGLEDYAGHMAALVQAIAGNMGLGLSRVIIYGSGSGGFAAARLACRLKGATACAIDAPANILQEPRCEDLVRACFNREPDELAREEKDKLSLMHELENSAGARILFVRNVEDAARAGQARELPATDVLARHKTATLELAASGDQPTDKFALAGRIIARALELAGINSIKPKIEKISSRHVYFIRSSLEDVASDAVYFQPSGRGDMPKTPIAPPFDWNANPWKDNNWFAQLQMWRPLDDYFFRFEETGDKKWLAMPIALIQDWHRYYAANAPVKYVWADMNVGLRMMKLAWLLSMHHSRAIRLGPYFLKVAASLVDMHLKFLFEKYRPAWSNHTLMDMHGAVALARILPPLEAFEVFKFTDRIICELIGRQFNAAGVHLENSPAYQRLGAVYLERLIRCGWFENLNLRPLVKKAHAVMDWLTMPDGRHAPIGDTDGKPAPAGEVKCVPEKNGLFNSSGYAIGRQASAAGSASYLFFMAACNSPLHKHSDDLSLIWYEGEDILCDTGKYAYQKSPKREYAISTRAHNTLEIDGISTWIPGSDADNPPTGERIEYAERRAGIYRLGAALELPRFQGRHLRRLFWLPDRFLICVDEFAASREHAIKAHWHLSPEIRIKEAAGLRLEATLASGRPMFLQCHSSTPASLSVIRGQTEPVLQGFISRGYRKLEPNDCVCVETKAANWLLVSAFSLDHDHMLREEGENRFSFTFGDRNYGLERKDGKWEMTQE